MAARLEEMNALSIRVRGGRFGSELQSSLVVSWGCGMAAWLSLEGDERAAHPGAQQAPELRRRCWRAASPSPAPGLALRALALLARSPSARTHSPALARPPAPPLQVASLKLELAALKAEQDEREDALLGQVRGRGGWC